MPANTDAKNAANVKIEVHLLQNFAPSCLNRDDTNTPKDCEFGGYRRARISSQCFKRATREFFAETNQVEIGQRTKRFKAEILSLLPPLLEEVANTSIPNDLLPFAVDTFLHTYYSALDPKRPEETKVLIFLSPAEKILAATLVRDMLIADSSELRSVAEKRQQMISKLAEKGGKALEEALADSEEDDASEDESKGKVKKGKLPKLKRDKRIVDQLASALKSADIALFGRMLAENNEMKSDASCQVAHSLSTHAVDLEMDFYTAVDDLNPKADTGAGMLGVTGYNSACFYRYALLDRAQLVGNLGGDADLADKVIEAFLTAFTRAIPKARQNGMAAHNPPSFGLDVVRDGAGTPVSLANAFADPVASDRLKDRSVAALAYYWTRLNEVYGADGVASTALFFDGEIEDVSPLVRYGKRQPAVASFLEGADKGSAAAAVAATMDAVQKAAGA